MSHDWLIESVNRSLASLQEDMDLFKRDLKLALKTNNASLMASSEFLVEATQNEIDFALSERAALMAAQNQSLVRAKQMESING